MSQSRPVADDSDSTLTLPPANGSGAGPEPSNIGTDTTVHTPHQPNARTASDSALPVVDPSRYAIAGELAHGGIGRILRAVTSACSTPPSCPCTRRGVGPGASPSTP